MKFPTFRKPAGVVEEAIQDAMTRGDFDNLKNKGRPLKIEGDLARRDVMGGKLRRDAGFGAPWEDVGREIEVLTARAAEDFRRAVLLRESGLASPKADKTRVELQYQQNLTQIETQIRAINSLILKFNLLLPPLLPALYRRRITLEDLQH